MAIDFRGGQLVNNTVGTKDVLDIDEKFSPDGVTPAFFAYRDAGHVASPAQIIFNGTRLNNGGHYNTTTGFFTAPYAGAYWFHVWTMDNSGSTQYTNDYIRLQKNSVANGELRIYTSQNGAYRAHRSGGQLFTMVAGDTMRVFNQSAQVYGTNSVYCYFCGVYVG